MIKLFQGTQWMSKGKIMHLVMAYGHRGEEGALAA
jgi:hypothetical protein